MNKKIEHAKKLISHRITKVFFNFFTPVSTPGLATDRHFRDVWSTISSFLLVITGYRRTFTSYLM